MCAKTKPRIASCGSVTGAAGREWEGVRAGTALGVAQTRGAAARACDCANSAKGRGGRTGDGLAMEVVRAMIARPVPDGALVGTAVGEHGEAAEEWARRVRAVRPQPVRATRDPKAGDRPQQEGKPQRRHLAARDLEEAPEAEEVDECDVRAHRPADVFERPVQSAARPMPISGGCLDVCYSMQQLRAAEAARAHHGGRRSCCA